MSSVATASAAMIAMPMPKTYISVGGNAICGCAVGVATAADTANEDSADDG